MNVETLREEPIKTIVAWDTETAQIRAGRQAPELSCLSYQTYDITTQAKSPSKIVDRHEAGALLWMWLSDPTILLVGQNVSFDVAVLISEFPNLLEAFFRAYDADRVADTMIREKLIMIACGRAKGWMKEDGEWTRARYDLEALAKRHAGITLDKDTWRMRYGELRDKPLEEWPEGALHYPRMDAEATLAVFLSQEDAKEYIPDQFNQTRFALAKHLTSCRGVKTDAASVLKLKAQTEQQLEDIKQSLIEAGLVRKNGTKDTKAAKALMVKVCEEQGLTVRKTKKDGIALDADACDATDDETLIAYAEYTTLSAIINKDIVMLLAGTKTPIHTSFGLAESGRTTSSSNKALGGSGTGNLQNIRRGVKKKRGESDEAFAARKKSLIDIRQCFVPRAGMVFLQADYEQLELRTLAQVCFTLFGHSKLRDALNAGRDPHSEVAALLLKKPYEWVIENKKLYEVDMARQTGKVANFGFPGGLGAKNLCKFAKKTYGVVISEAEARDLKSIWLSLYPEMSDFFDYVGQLKGGPVTQLFSNRIRGGTTFCQACNTFFQGQGADASCMAWWLLTKACFIDQGSPLYGCRVVLSIHDEFFVEAPEGPHMHEAALEVERLMVKGAKMFLPDVDVQAPPIIMRYWSKDAKAVYDENDRLVPWTAT